MSAKLEIFEAVKVTIDGSATIDVPARPLDIPKKEVAVSTLPGSLRSFTVPKRTPSSPQPAPTLLWEWTEEEGFPSFIYVDVKEGSLRLAWLVDAATDEDTDDFSPAGTHEKVNNVDWSDYCAFRLNLTTAYVNATLADAAGLDADDYPAIFTDAGSGSGYVYKLWAINPSTTDDVICTVYTKG